MPEIGPKTLQRHNEAATRTNPEKSGIRSGNPQLRERGGDRRRAEDGDPAPHAPIDGSLQAPPARPGDSPAPARPPRAGT